MVTHTNFLAWKIPWRKEPGGLHCMGLQRVWEDWAHMHTSNLVSDWKLFSFFSDISSCCSHWRPTVLFCFVFMHLLNMTASFVESGVLPSLHPQLVTSFLLPGTRSFHITLALENLIHGILFFCLWLITSFLNAPLSGAVMSTIEGSGNERKW